MFASEKSVGTALLAGSAAAADRVLNPNFDADVADWMQATPGVTWIAAPDSRGDPASGALRWSQSGSVTLNGPVASQCLAIEAGSQRRKFEGALRLDPVESGTASAKIQARFYGGADCGGTLIATQTLLSSSEPARWLRARYFISAGDMMLPTGTASVRVELTVNLDNASNPGVVFDTVYYGPPQPPGAPLQALVESFDALPSPDPNGLLNEAEFALANAGWVTINNSAPLGSPSSWFRGVPTVFAASDGEPSSFGAASYLSATQGSGSVLSNWLLSPVLSFAPERDCVSFRTRTRTASTFPDRVAVRLSTAAASVDVGDSATSVGDFTNVLTVINRNYLSAPRVCPPMALNAGEEIDAAYPEQWCEFRLCGLPDSGSGRIAIRHSITDTQVNGNYVGVDAFRFPAPGPLGTSTIAITSDGPDPSLPGASYVVSVAASGAGAAPTGRVIVSDGSETCVVGLVNGSGSCALASPVSGERVLTAYYSGDVVHASAMASAPHVVRDVLFANGFE